MTTPSPDRGGAVLVGMGLSPLVMGHLSTALYRHLEQIRRRPEDRYRTPVAELDELWRWLREASIADVSTRLEPTKLAIPGDEGEDGARLIDLDTAAARLGISRRSVERFRAAGLLRVVRMGRRVLVRPEDLAAFVAESEAS